MRLIDADELKKNFQDELCKGIACDECSMQAGGFCRVERWINIAPTVDAEPIKHGRWIKWEGDVLTCSNCKHYWIQSGDQYDYRYCPYCEARMDAKIGEDPSHPFAESVMMHKDEVEE